jgi:hypothetical protein
MVGSITSRRNARRGASVRSSSAPNKAAEPDTSSARIAAIFRLAIVLRPLRLPDQRRTVIASHASRWELHAHRRHFPARATPWTQRPRCMIIP